MKVFKGERHSRGGTTVVVDGEPLDMMLHQVNHSPLGFEWGYNGSEPLQLSYAILMETTKNLEITKALYDKYSDQVISTIKKDKWKIIESEVQDWLENQIEYIDIVEEKAFHTSPPDLYIVTREKELKFEGIRHRLDNHVTITVDDRPLNIPSDFPKLGGTHSNDLEFGFNGQGPRELALAILAHVSEDYEYTKRVYKEFAKDVIFDLPDKWVLYESEIKSWMRDHEYETEIDYIDFEDVKSVSRAFGMGYQEIADRTGYKLSAIKKAASTGEVSSQLQKSMEMMDEIRTLRTKLDSVEIFKNSLRGFLK